MMATLLVKPRYKAYIQQNGVCIYCEAPMWLDDPGPFALLYSMTLAQARHFKCTADHLKAKKDGGKDNFGNISTAWIYCNSPRHKPKLALDSLAFKKRVEARLVKGGWNRFGYKR